MSKRDDKDEDVTGAAGFAKIARGLSDLFNVLSELDTNAQPRRGRHEKNGVVMEYSFGRRAANPEGDTEEAAPSGFTTAPKPAPPPPSPKRRAAKPTGLEVLEPVTDLFDEPEEIVLLFELPGIVRKDIRCVLDGDILLLEAKTEERLYRKETLIETPLTADAPRLSLRNGVLEVRLAKARP